MGLATFSLVVRLAIDSPESSKDQYDPKVLSSHPSFKSKLMINGNIQRPVKSSAAPSRAPATEKGKIKPRKLPLNQKQSREKRKLFLEKVALSFPQIITAALVQALFRLTLKAMPPENLLLLSLTQIQRALKVI